MQRRDFNRGLVGAALAIGTPTLRAQAWPDRPVKWILSQPPGSGPDNVARVLSDRLAKTWVQAVVIENKPGGQNTIGAQAAARSPADGSNFYFATTAALVTNPLLFKTLPYDPAKDFVPVAFIARSPFALLVSGDSPLKTLEELIACSKAEAGRLTIGNQGPRTFSGMIARLFNARSQAGANLVPYASVGVGTQDLIGGHRCDGRRPGLGRAARAPGPAARAGNDLGQTCRGLGSGTGIGETLPGFDMVGWFAIVAPTGTQAAAIDRSNRDVNALLNEKDVAERIAAIGQIVDGSMGAEQVGAFLRAESVRWAAITKEIDILPE